MNIVTVTWKQQSQINVIIQEHSVIFSTNENRTLIEHLSLKGRLIIIIFRQENIYTFPQKINIFQTINFPLLANKNLIEI